MRLVLILGRSVLVLALVLVLVLASVHRCDYDANVHYIYCFFFSCSVCGSSDYIYIYASFFPFYDIYTLLYWSSFHFLSFLLLLHFIFNYWVFSFFYVMFGTYIYIYIYILSVGVFLFLVSSWLFSSLFPLLFVIFYWLSSIKSSLSPPSSVYLPFQDTVGLFITSFLRISRLRS